MVWLSVRLGHHIHLLPLRLRPLDLNKTDSRIRRRSIHVTVDPDHPLLLRFSWVRKLLQQQKLTYRGGAVHMRDMSRFGMIPSGLDMQASE